MQKDTRFLGLDELVSGDMSSYELFNSLSPKQQRKIKMRDYSSFEEINGYLYPKKHGKNRYHQ